jgi:teichuronic acid exporter
MTPTRTVPLMDSVSSGLRWATFSRLLTQILTWASTLLVVRLLAPTDYGLAAMATMLAGYLTMWNELGLSITLIQRRTTDEPTLRAVFGLLLAIGGVLCLITALASPLIATAFGDRRITPLACVISLSFLVMPFAIIPQARLSMDMNIRALSLVGLVSALAGAAVTLSLAWAGAGAYALVLGTLAIAVVRAVALNSVAPFLRRPRWQPRELLHMASYSMNVMLSRTIWYWYSEADILIVGRTLGASLLGIYSLGRQLAMMPMDRVGEIANMVALPAYASVGRELARVRDAYVRSIRLVSTIAFPLFWGLSMVAFDLIKALLGPQWLAAIPVLQVLCIVMPLRTIGSLTSAPLQAVGRADTSLKFVAMPALLVPLCLLIGSHWQLQGVAIAWVVAYPIAWCAGTIVARSALNVTLGDVLKPMLAPAASAAAMVLLVGKGQQLLPWTSPLLLLGVKAICGAAVYFASLFLISRSHYSDLIVFSFRMLGRRQG